MRVEKEESGRVHHFVNLVSLPHHVTNIDDSRNYYVDSISFSLVLKLLKIPHKRTSGIVMYQAIKSLDSTYYFLPKETDAEIVGEVLPFLEIDVIDSFVKEIMKGLDLFSYQRIVIGISSPKQDMFGVKLADYYSGDIYCLGAAIQFDEKRVISIVDSIGFTWLFMFFRAPRRTIKKMIISICELFRIFISSDYRSAIKRMNFK